MDLGIAGRKAIVCGASRGLGFACASQLAQEGVAVTLVSRSGPALTDAALRIREIIGQSPTILVADLATEQGVAEVISAAHDVDILVTNAGGPPTRDFQEISRKDWSDALGTNFLAAVELIRALAPKMASRSFGRIVNITSMSVRVPISKLDLSTATRLALTGYVAGVSRQIAAQGVTINNLLPGTIMTERIAEVGAAAAALIARVPVGRAGTPEEFAAACAFLCSRQAAFITGQNVLVDGGLCTLTI